MEDVDQVFPFDYASEFFFLMRTWHGVRGEYPWSRLRIILTYATEAHLFIPNLHESIFNVGTRVYVKDFTRREVDELNQQLGEPLGTEMEKEQFYRLLGGQPYLTNRGLHEIRAHNLSIHRFEQLALKDDGLFGDHLGRMRELLSRDRELLEAIRVVLTNTMPQSAWKRLSRSISGVVPGLKLGTSCPTASSFKRLRSAGIVTGESEQSARPRCDLYARYLSRHLL